MDSRSKNNMQPQAKQIQHTPSHGTPVLAQQKASTVTRGILSAEQLLQLQAELECQRGRQYGKPGPVGTATH
jgi:hypothetical protein